MLAVSFCAVYTPTAYAAVLAPLDQQPSRERLVESAFKAAPQTTDKLNMQGGRGLSYIDADISQAGGSLSSYSQQQKRLSSNFGADQYQDHLLDSIYHDTLSPNNTKAAKRPGHYEITGVASLDRTMGAVMNDLKDDPSFRKIYFSVKSLQMDIQLANSSLWFTSDIPKKGVVKVEKKDKSQLDLTNNGQNINMAPSQIKRDNVSLKNFVREYWHWIGTFAILVGLLEYFIWRIVTRGTT